MFMLQKVDVTPTFLACSRRLDSGETRKEKRRKKEGKKKEGKKKEGKKGREKHER